MSVSSPQEQMHAPRPSRHDGVGRLAVHTVWLLRLRWVACAGQLLTIAYAAFVYGVRVPIGELLAVIAAVALSNALLFVGWRRLEQGDATISWSARGNWLLA